METKQPPTKTAAEVLLLADGGKGRRVEPDWLLVFQNAYQHEPGEVRSLLLQTYPELMEYTPKRITALLAGRLPVERAEDGWAVQIGGRTPKKGCCESRRGRPRGLQVTRRLEPRPFLGADAGRAG